MVDMKKLVMGFLILSGCTSTTTPEMDKSTTPQSVSEAPSHAPVNPIEPLDGETRQSFLERQISLVSSEISDLEPKMIATSVSMNPRSQSENTKLKEQLFALERKKASLELQLLSLP
jgi:TolA-binding protein